jgi:endoglucanase
MLRTAKSYLFAALTLALLTATCVVATEPNAASAKPDSFKMNKMLGRGVNFGNALEAPTEGAWGVVVKEEYFDILKQAGFNSVRLPVNWSGHALKEKPYTINPDFFKRVDTIVGWAISRNMPIIVNIHQYNETYDAPLEQKERFVGLWKQIAEHYKDYPDILLFEAMNEPKRKLTAAIWNDYIKAF